MIHTGESFAFIRWFLFDLIVTNSVYQRYRVSLSYSLLSSNIAVERMVAAHCAITSSVVMCANLSRTWLVFFIE